MTGIAFALGPARRAAALLSLGSVLWSCARQPALGDEAALVDQTAVLGQPFRLARGKTAGLEGRGMRIRFECVSEDSRCPTGVQCVWAGDARVVLRLSEAGRAAAVDTLRLTVEPRAVTYGAYVIRLEALEPAPRQNAPPRADDYVATLVISAAVGR